MSMNLSVILVLNIKGTGYRGIFSEIRKSKAVNLLQKTGFLKSGTLQNIRIFHI